MYFRWDPLEWTPLHDQPFDASTCCERGRHAQFERPCEQRVSISPQSKVADVASAPLPLPPPPRSLPQGFRHSRSPHLDLSDVVQPSPIKVDKFIISKRTTQFVEPAMKSKRAVAVACFRIVVAEVVNKPESSPKKVSASSESPARLSRWADENNSPKDEGEASDEEVMVKRRKKTPLINSADMIFKTKVPTPELGELPREGSEGAASKSNFEKDGRRNGPAS